MKRLFCTVVTSYDDTLESPLIYHTRAENAEAVEAHVKSELMELGWTEEDTEENFDLFSFPVGDLDIVEL